MRAAALEPAGAAVEPDAEGGVEGGVTVSATESRGLEERSQGSTMITPRRSLSEAVAAALGRAVLAPGAPTR